VLRFGEFGEKADPLNWVKEIDWSLKYFLTWSKGHIKC